MFEPHSKPDSEEVVVQNQLKNPVLQKLYSGIVVVIND